MILLSNRALANRVAELEKLLTETNLGFKSGEQSESLFEDFIIFIFPNVLMDQHCKDKITFMTDSRLAFELYVENFIFSINKICFVFLSHL